METLRWRAQVSTGEVVELPLTLKTLSYSSSKGSSQERSVRVVELPGHADFERSVFRQLRVAVAQGAHPDLKRLLGILIWSRLWPMASGHHQTTINWKTFLHTAFVQARDFGVPNIQDPTDAMAFFGRDWLKKNGPSFARWKEALNFDPGLLAKTRPHIAEGDKCLAESSIFPNLVDAEAATFSNPRYRGRRLYGSGLDVDFDKRLRRRAQSVLARCTIYRPELKPIISILAHRYLVREQGRIMEQVLSSLRDARKLNDFEAALFRWMYVANDLHDVTTTVPYDIPIMLSPPLASVAVFSFGGMGRRGPSHSIMTLPAVLTLAEDGLGALPKHEREIQILTGVAAMYRYLAGAKRERDRERKAAGRTSEDKRRRTE